MGAQQSLPVWQPMSQQFYQLRILTREIESLHHTKTALNNQLPALSHAQFKGKSTQKRLQSMMKLIDKQIESIQSEVTQLVESDSELKKSLPILLKSRGSD